MPYASAVVERTMKVQEVLMQAISGQLTWLQAEEILGWRPRTLRRWRLRYQRVGYDGLWDRRRQQPSPRRAPVAEVARIVRLYRERYAGFNAAHFHEIAQREHQVPYAYTFVKRLLQAAQLLPKRRPRGRHRRRREPRPCFGEMLHLDGSPHAWLARRPTERQTLLQSIDDATKRVLYAQLVPAESTATVMTALWTISRNARPASSPVHRSRRLGLLHPESGGARGPRQAHPGRPRPGPPRHRAHPRLLPAGSRSPVPSNPVPPTSTRHLLSYWVALTRCVKTDPFSASYGLSELHSHGVYVSVTSERSKAVGPAQ
jgi:transposase